jgi:acyl-coenzyme A thioesterase PaaI-like protein
MVPRRVPQCERVRSFPASVSAVLDWGAYAEIVPETSSSSDAHSAHDPRTIDAPVNHCFGCSPVNPVGLRLQFVIDASASGGVTATAPVQLTRLYEGPAGYIHGGVIATLVDEAMSKLNKPLKVSAMTRRLEIEYFRPSPVDVLLTLVGRHVRREGRKLFHLAELLNTEGEMLVRAKGLFIVIEPSASRESA